MNTVQHAVQQIQVAVEEAREDGDQVVGRVGLEAEIERVVSRAYCDGAASGEVWRLHTLRQLYRHHPSAALRILQGEDVEDVLEELGADAAIGRGRVARGPGDDGVGRAIGRGHAHRPRAVRWYRELQSADRDRVQQWLRENPPPEGWNKTRVAYAYHRMPGVALEEPLTGPGFMARGSA